jgi:hypothetical protein
MKRKVVILGMFVNDASIQRHLCKLGYQVWGVSHLKEEGFYSRYGKKVLCPDPETDPRKWTSFMVKLGLEVGGRPVLIPTSDLYVLAVEKAANILNAYYRFQGYGSGMKTRLTYKYTQLEIA